MTENNVYLPKENYKKVEEVREIENEYPSYEEFMKTYKYDDNLNYADLRGSDVGTQKGYGPCKKDGCNCSCNWDGCSCKLFKSERWGSEEYGVKKWYHKSSVGGKIDLGGPRIEAGGSTSYLKGENDDEEYSLFGVSAKRSFSMGEDGIDVKTNLGLDLYKFKDKDKKISIRPNVDTGVSTEDGSLEVKAGGFGLSVGKYTGLNTPLGELKVNTEDCVIQ
jgi:hypothetical protein